MARPQDDGARAVQRRRDNPDAAGNHRRREKEARDLQAECEEQLHFLQYCKDGRDAAMLAAVRQWAAAHEPDGTDNWWLEVQRVAHAAQTQLRSYNQLAILTHPRCWRIDVAAVEEMWELHWLGCEVYDASIAAWEAAGSPYPRCLSDWLPATHIEQDAEFKRRHVQPMHKREGSSCTFAALQTRQQLADAGFNVACKHTQCCDKRDCWKYERSLTTDSTMPRDGPSLVLAGAA